MAIILDFEKPIVELENKIEELKKFTSKESIDLSDEIAKLTERLEKLKKEVFTKLTPWQRVQLARHPARPYTLDYISMIMTDFMEIHGDRHFGDDKSMIAGLAKVDGQKVVVIGQQKGRDMKDNLKRNFGCAHPEGYRKALRVMYLAEKFNIPIVCFIDTPGAYPGIGAEERGQAEAIAFNLREMAGLRVPIVIFVIGEGGSGGALGIGIGDRVYVLENAYYSVISPEGCAAILWKEPGRAADAAAALKLGGLELMELGVIDGVVAEPLGGAHRDPQKTAQEIKRIMLESIKTLSAMSAEKLVEARYNKFRKMGVYKE